MANEYFQNLGKSGLQSIPDEVFQMKELKELRLHSNGIEEIPPSIFRLEQLETLNLTNNKLKRIPDEVFHLPNLKVLLLGGNQIQQLPKSIKYAQKLERLFLENNQLTTLPQELSELQDLNRLQLHRNKFIAIPEVLFHISFLEDLEISLVESNYELPKKLWNWHRLETLKLTDAGLRKLSKGFIHLTRLNTLNLCRNQLDKFPKEILAIRGLKKLYLNSNQLRELPEDISALRQLSHLNIGDNQLTKLPDNIIKLPNLKDLSVSKNQLENLPPVKGNGRSFEILRASKNRLKVFPEDYLHLPKLKKLILNHNPLEISNELFESFSKINWEVPLMKEALEKDKYRGKEAVNHVKLILVGDKRSGRSSWIRNIMEDEVELGEKLDIVFTKFTHQRNDQLFEVTVSIWEPGHLGLKHPTHHLIGDPHAIYLIFVDATNRQKDKEKLIQFWTNQLLKVGVINPVIVVHSKIDEKVTEMPDFADKFPFEFIKHEISFLENYIDTVHELKDKLKEQIFNRFRLNQEVAKGHQMVKNYIRDLRPSKRYLSEQEFEEICNKAWIETNDIPDLRKFLHETGVLLSFRNEENGKPHIFSDIHWLMEAIHLLFEYPKIQQTGKFNKRDLSVIWKGLEIARHGTEILLLISGEPFQFCFGLGEDEYVIPHLLPSIFEDRNWPQIPNYAYRWVYRYEDLPAELFFLLMGESYLLEHKPSYWKEGIYFRYKKGGVWIRQTEDLGQDTVEIAIQGDRDIRRKLKNDLTKVFIGLHQRLELMQSIGEFALCPFCKENGKKSFIDMEIVVRRHEAGRYHTPCNQCFNDIKIEHLLYGRSVKTLATMKSLIRIDKVREALLELEFYVRFYQIDHFENELLVHMSNYPETPKNENEYLIQNRIKSAILQIIKEIEEENE